MRWRLLGFAVAIAFWPGLLSEALVPRWAVIAIGVPLVSRLDPRALGVPVWGLLVWLIGLAAASIIVSPDRLTGGMDLIFLLILSMAFIAAAGLDSLDDVMTGLGAGLAVSSALAIGQWYGWNPVARGSGAPPGLFFNSEVLAELAALVFVWAVVRPRWLIAAAAAVPLIVCQSRVGALAVAVALFYAWRPRSWLLSGLIVVGVLASGFLAIFMLGADKIHSAGERLVVWVGMVEALQPLGRGLGWTLMSLPRQQFVHSDALQAVLEVGYGAIALALIPFLAFWKKRGNLAERALFAAVCVEVVVSFPLHVPANGFIAALAAGVLLGRGGVVRVGEPDGRGEDRVGAQRHPGFAYGIRGAGGRRHRAFSVRPDAAPGTALYQAAGG